MPVENSNRDLVLAPGEFAYVLDTTKGLVNVNVGPYKTSMANTDQPVIWNREKLRFVRCDLDISIQRNAIAPEGFYMALYNPAGDDKQAHPRVGASQVAVDLTVGHRINIPGPAHFPLWPGQMADVIRGHHLRSNQYLLAQVYNDQEASENWAKAVVKPAGGSDATVATPTKFAPGQLMVIKGTEVAFFIPPTGIKVVPESTEKPPQFVRDAVTLERLEYCILLDEDGNKRFVPGPDVVFPEPTETFVTKDGARKFRAIELNENTGIYVKVIADYDEGEGDAKKHYKIGDELFITGKEQAIYFQREEHSIIRYGDQTKHYAVAVPAGEGRYVLDRITGEIRLVRGPRMLLCDPRREVIVRRVLAEKTVRLWYPNNDTVVQVNKALEAASVGNLNTMLRGSPSQYAAPPMKTTANYMAYDETPVGAAANVTPTSKQIAGDQFARGTSFTPPRTITLDTKYEGAVSVAVWSGYAVLIVNKTGQRRVVIGPEAVLLEYDETLAPLELSTGTPKKDEPLLRTVYLRVRNNKVSDKITVETSDLVQVDLTLSYRVNFEGDSPEQWFAVENYVRLLCDHLRSLIRNVAKRTDVTTFYGNAIDIVRDAVLGKPEASMGKRAGRAFDENNMRVYDVEVLDATITDPDVESLLASAQTDAMTGALELARQERLLVQTQRVEAVKRDIAGAQTETLVNAQVLDQSKIAAQRTTEEARSAAELALETARQAKIDEGATADLRRTQARSTFMLDERKIQIDLELKRVVGESEEIVKRAAAVDPALAAALTAFADQEMMSKVAVALGPMASMSGVSVADVLAQLFGGTPFEGTMKALGARARIPVKTTA